MVSQEIIISGNEIVTMDINNISGKTKISMVVKRDHL